MSAPSASASGLSFYETGGPEVGLAGAGMAARAQDATTILGNPAGMTHLAGDQISAGFQVLAGNSRYAMHDDATLDGNNPGNVLSPLPSASVFYSHSIDDRLKIGVGAYGNFGLAAHYGDWAGAGLVKDAGLIAFNLQPTVAYRVNDKWSVGAGLGISYGYFSLNRDAAGGEQKEKDYDWAANAHLGVLYDLDARTRFGLKYTSETRYDFAIDPQLSFSHTFRPVPDGAGVTVSRSWTLPLAAMVNSPQQLMFSGYHALNEQWAVLGNLGWQDWSRFGDSTIEAAGSEVSSGNKLQDTWHAALGIQYRPNEKWRFDGGIAYDTSIYQRQSDTSLTIPTGAEWRFGVGAQYRLDARSTVGAAFEYLRMQGSSVQNPLFKGEFETGHLYFFSANYAYTFD
ncbi:OmpP1/FadL family transporter [Jeongeupia sp. USM3]|uniref:OmpP1/FadL family transporter n=1 Tax=Jeongeupia sp. USM3 TaxID=1906741 RepID=UPI00196B5E7B|nr:outer membrane protein transport protein [Jeongeupia sp. USM3]